MKFLAKINVYNLLIFLLVIISFFGIIKFGIKETLPQLIIAVITCGLIDSLIDYFEFRRFRVSKSSVITGFFIGLVLSIDQTWYVPLVASLIAVCGKHIGGFLMKKLFNYNSHIFNPAIFGIFICLILFNTIDGWWGATNLILILLLGILLLYKFKRFHLTLTFLATYFILSLVFGNNFFNLILDSTIYFFSIFMLTEPKTSPNSFRGRIIYGLLSGVIIALMINSFAGLFSGYSLILGLLICNLCVPFLNKLNFLHK